MSEKRYIGTAKVRETQYGALLSQGLPIEDLEKLIAEKKAQGKTWINLTIGKRKEVSEKGMTHSVWVDDYEPNQSGGQQNQQAANTPNMDDDIPF